MSEMVPDWIMRPMVETHIVRVLTSPLGDLALQEPAVREQLAGLTTDELATIVLDMHAEEDE